MNPEIQAIIDLILVGIILVAGLGSVLIRK